MNCSDTKISELGDYPNLEILNIVWSDIEKLGEYPNLEKLKCSGRETLRDKYSHLIY